MPTTYDDIRGLPMKMGSVTYLSGMTTMQWHSSSRGSEGVYRYCVQLSTTGSVEMADWCEENCEYDYSGAEASVFWMFISETDAIAFKLRWV